MLVISPHVVFGDYLLLRLLLLALTFRIPFTLFPFNLLANCQEPVILFKHVLRSAAPAGLTVLSLNFIGMLGGVVIIEQIFALPGMGALAVQSTTLGDTPLVMGVVLYTVIIVIIVNLLVDLANGWLNPKVRVS